MVNLRLDALKQRFPSLQALDPAPVKDCPTIRLTAPGETLAVLTELKRAHGFDYLDFITAIDWKGPVSLAGFVKNPNPNPFLPEGATPQSSVTATPGFVYKDVFEVVYAMTDLATLERLMVRVELPRAVARIASAVTLWNAADWQEREIFDLFGIIFEGHPNLVKILTPDFTEGHPLRKDYVHIKDRYD